MSDNQKVTKEWIKKACKELEEMLIAKNEDYGNSFQEQFEEHGMTSVIIRLEDKLRRLKSLKNQPSSKVNEKIEDTLLDSAGYNVLAHICVMIARRKEEGEQLAISEGLAKVQKNFVCTCATSPLCPVHPFSYDKKGDKEKTYLSQFEGKLTP